MQNSLDKKAWSILNTDEQTALSIQYGIGKSSWQSGEIMEKSHYKYLEIKYRAEHFLKMFTRHFNLYPNFIPNCLSNTHQDILCYLTYCIIDRKKIFDAYTLTIHKYPENTSTKDLKNKIIDFFTKIDESSVNIHKIEFINLVKEFDRWNNFRILPEEIREPSAFKRRLKNNYKKHIAIYTSLPSLSIIKLVDICKKKHGKLYWPYLEGKNTPKVISIKNDKKTIDLLTSMCLYLFEDNNVAQQYIDEVSSYHLKNQKACIDGLNFWPKYRELIKKSINYKEIQNIVPNRKYLKSAGPKLEFI